MTRLLPAALVLAACGSLDAASRAAKLESPVCQAQDAKAAFGSNAICACENVGLAGSGLIVKGAAPGNVGVNGRIGLAGLYDIGGSLIVMQGIGGAGDLRTGASFSTAGDVVGAGRISVGGDMMVGGTLSTAGTLEVAGTLGVQGEALLTGFNTVKRGAYVAPKEPCGCGTPAVDVAARVADAKANGTRLAETVAVGSTKVTLTTGTYFAESLTSAGELDITIDGAVALAIGGSLDAAGKQHISLTPGSTLDLYVAEGIAAAGDTFLGAGATPGSVRLYVGGHVLAAGAQRLNASLYAPNADFAVAGDTTVNGSLFARSITGAGRLTVDYAAPTMAAPDKCVGEEPQPTREGGSGTPTRPADGNGSGPIDPG